MVISINGDNNRAAGNNYIEINHSTPEICPCCEQRYLIAKRKCCRHCQELYEKEIYRQTLEHRFYKLFIIPALFILLSYLSYKMDNNTLNCFGFFTAALGVFTTISFGFLASLFTKKQFYKNR